MYKIKGAAIKKISIIHTLGNPERGEVEIESTMLKKLSILRKKFSSIGNFIGFNLNQNLNISGV